MCIELFELFGVSFLAVMLTMTILWGVCCLYKNVSIVDLGWGASFFLVALACLFFGDGNFSKKLFMVTLVMIWSGRLVWHLGKRFDLKVEDPRYQKIMDGFGKENQDFKAYLMFLFQGLLVLILSTPIILVSGYSERPWEFYEGLGFAVWLIGIYGESVSDRQLEKFKRNPKNKGKVCQEGWWKFSRHPNYFFEWVVWIGFFLIALPTWGGSFAIISPLLMLILLTRVSGIPPAERQALESKGEAYREYQKKTSAFVPWFPKKG